jgi:hypothetical protein
MLIPFYSHSPLRGSSAQAMPILYDPARWGLSFIDFQRLPALFRLSHGTTRKPSCKDLFMVLQIYLWPIYFYRQQKIYYFDLLKAIA